MFTSLRRVVEVVKAHRNVVAVGVTVVVAGGLVYWLLPSTSSPLPADLKQQVSFKVVYPAATDQIDNSSWKYSSDSKNLSFQAQVSGHTVVMSEQEVPLAYLNDQAAYDRFLGSLRPQATFKVPLGSVSLVNFVTSGDFQPTGMAAILKTQDTLLIVHPDDQLSQDDWLNFFKSLKIGN